jgi:hypothetical protein
LDRDLDYEQEDILPSASKADFDRGACREDDGTEKCWEKEHIID